MVGAATTTPHDALFKAAFSKVRHARGLLRALVPEALGRRIAWPTLRIESGIAVGDEDLGEQRMDLEMTAGGRVAILSLKHGRDPIAIRIRVRNMLERQPRAPASA
jgi:hypothetical protein